MLLQLAELTKIGTPGTTNILIQHVRKRRVCQRQPAARRNAVSDVTKTGRKNLRKIREQRLHHQVGMEFRNAVDFMADHHRQPGHPYPATVRLINNRRASKQAGIVGILLLHRFQEIVVNLEDNLQVTGQNFPQHIDGPGLQRLAHQRMVGIREDLTAHLKRVVPAKFMFINQQAHQLRN